MDFSSIADAIGGLLDEYGVPAGLLAQGAGTALRRRAIARVQAEQQAALAAERAKQRRISDEIAQRTAQAALSAGSAQSEAGRQSLAAKYEQYMTPTVGAGDFGEYSAATPDAPKEVQDSAARTLATSLKKGKDYAKGLAEMASYGGQQQALSRTLGDAARDVGTLQRSSAASSATLPYRLENANNRASGLMTASDIANGLGTAAFVYGVNGSRRAAPKPQVPFYGVGASPY